MYSPEKTQLEFNRARNQIKAALEATPHSRPEDGTAGGLLRKLLVWLADWCTTKDGVDAIEALAAKGLSWEAEFGCHVIEIDDDEEHSSPIVRWGTGSDYTWVALENVLEACHYSHDWVPDWWDAEWTELRLPSDKISQYAYCATKAFLDRCTKSGVTQALHDLGWTQRDFLPLLEAKWERWNAVTSETEILSMDFDPRKRRLLVRHYASWDSCAWELQSVNYKKNSEAEMRNAAVQAADRLLDHFIVSRPVQI